MSQLEAFQRTTVKITPSFIQDSRIDGTVKLIVILENAYLRSVEQGLIGCSSHRYPSMKFISTCLGLVYQTISAKKRSTEYKLHSPTHNDGKNMIYRRGQQPLGIPISLITSRLTVYEKLTSI